MANYKDTHEKTKSCGEKNYGTKNCGNEVVPKRHATKDCYSNSVSNNVKTQKAQKDSIRRDGPGGS